MTVWCASPVTQGQEYLRAMAAGKQLTRVELARKLRRNAASVMSIMASMWTTKAFAVSVGALLQSVLCARIRRNVTSAIMGIMRRAMSVHHVRAQLTGVFHVSMGPFALNVTLVMESQGMDVLCVQKVASFAEIHSVCNATHHGISAIGPVSLHVPAVRLSFPVDCVCSLRHLSSVHRPRSRKPLVFICRHRFHNLGR